MADDKKTERPATRSQTVTVRLTEEEEKKAKERAKREGRNLASILRAWLRLWGEDEAPSPPVMPDENVRAKKRSKKKKEN